VVFLIFNASEEEKYWRTETSTTRNEFRNSKRNWKRQYCSEKNQIESLRRSAFVQTSNKLTIYLLYTSFCCIGGDPGVSWCPVRIPKILLRECPVTVEYRKDLTKISVILTELLLICDTNKWLIADFMSLNWRHDFPAGEELTAFSTSLAGFKKWALQRGGKEREDREGKRRDLFAKRSPPLFYCH